MMYVALICLVTVSFWAGHNVGYSKGLKEGHNKLKDAMTRKKTTKQKKTVVVGTPPFFKHLNTTLKSKI